MRVYLDLDTRQLITAPGFKTVVNILNFTRGDTPTLEIQFVQDGVVVESDADSVFFCIKPKGEFNGDPLVLLTDFTKTGTGADTVWSGKPNLNTDELAAAFGIDPVDADKAALASIETVGEIGFIVTGVGEAPDEQTSSRQIKTIIANDVYRGDEGLPQPATPAFTGLTTLVNMPTATTDAGAAGDYAVSDGEFAVYRAGTGWLFATLFQK